MKPQIGFFYWVTWPQFDYQSSSTCISECGTPSWACFIISVFKSSWIISVHRCSQCVNVLLFSTIMVSESHISLLSMFLIFNSNIPPHLLTFNNPARYIQVWCSTSCFNQINSPRLTSDYYHCLQKKQYLTGAHQVCPYMYCVQTLWQMLLQLSCITTSPTILCTHNPYPVQCTLYP